jgi:hypothetical protein
MDDGCLIRFNIIIEQYDPDEMLYFDLPCVSLTIEVEANFSEGFVDGLRISFSENYNWSQVKIWMEHYDIRTENLQTLKAVDFESVDESGQSLKGYVEAAGVNRPSHVYYRIFVDWVLQSPQNQSHSMTATLQLRYSDGTVLKEAVLPIVLKLAEDVGDTFEAAKEIGFGNYTGWHHILTDPEDFYKVWMEEGKTVKIQLSQKPPLGIILDLYFYNTSKGLAASSCSKIRNHTEEITYTINQSGWWHIRVVNADSAYGLYNLSIQEVELQ